MTFKTKVIISRQSTYTKRSEILNFTGYVIVASISLNNHPVTTILPEIIFIIAVVMVIMTA